MTASPTDRHAKPLRRVVIAGASGLIGSALVRSLRTDGIAVTTLVRRPTHTTDEVEWMPGVRPLEPDALADADAVVALNGASIGRLPWTPRYRRQLRDSRVTPTRTLAHALTRLGNDQPRLLSASAVGYYGSAPGVFLDENSPAGSTFLAQLCREWEQAATSESPDARVTFLRTASVLHPKALLAPLTSLARAGLAGRLGSGDQYWPWIALEDEVAAIRFLLEHPVTGAVNLVAPEATTERDVVRTLTRLLHRPVGLPVPSWALRALLGRRAADSLLLGDAKALPGRLQQLGFRFQYSALEHAMEHALSEPLRDPT